MQNLVWQSLHLMTGVIGQTLRWGRISLIKNGSRFGHELGQVILRLGHFESLWVIYSTNFNDSY